MRLEGKKIGFAITGSHCTIEEIIPEIEKIVNQGAEVLPIMSETVLNDKTRFGSPEKWTKKMKKVTGQKIIDSVVKAEPIGPQKLLDLLIVAPCTGNTLAKIANGIIDETVIMAAKAQLRNQNPVLISISTNDGLGLNFKNLSELINTENIFFVPFGQDNPSDKPNSLVSRSDLLVEAAEKALNDKQLQPVLIEYKGF